MFSFVRRSRSGRRLSPVMMDGEEKPGISAKREDPSIALIIMETFHFEFQLKLQLQISLLQGNL